MWVDVRSWQIYCDDAILAVNKPSGVRVLPDGYQPQSAHIRSLLEPHYGRLFIVHRLDKETSGILLLTRSPQAHRSLNLQFDHRLVEKIYHAVVYGCPPWRELDISHPLRTDGDRKHRTLVDLSRGKPALTHCRVIEKYQNSALLELQPKTGRTHQLRAHLAHAGYPILGDVLYAPAGQTQAQTFRHCIERLALHALSLRFSHPETNQPLILTAPYPSDFISCLQQLR